MLVVISRLIEAFMYIAVAPIPMSTSMNKEWGTIGTNWIRNILALAFQGLFIVVALGVFQAMFISSVKGLIENSGDTTEMYLSMQIRPTAFTIALIIYSSIALFLVYTEFGIDSSELSDGGFVLQI